MISLFLVGDQIGEVESLTELYLRYIKALLAIVFPIQHWGNGESAI